MERIKKPMNERNLSEGQWEDRAEIGTRCRTMQENVLEPIYIHMLQ
jgi:hypothetical protein